jgi:peptidoglycan-associated lipoprotein
MKSTPTFFMALTIVIVLLVAFAGCAKHATAHATTPATPVAPAPTRAAARAPVSDAQVSPASPHVAVAADLAAACRLSFPPPTQAPTFAFDDAQLLPEDRDVLTQVAQCLTSGPLAGRGLALIGRADPRGTDEYNLALGSRRAESVASYLERLGVASAKISDTTRGALDATGRDEAGWRLDRRVDLRLAD